MARDLIIHKGKSYYSVPAVARMLGTTTTKVKTLMGQGKLDWTQVRLNGRILIPAQSLLAYKLRKDSV